MLAILTVTIVVAGVFMLAGMGPLPHPYPPHPTERDQDHMPTPPIHKETPPPPGIRDTETPHPLAKAPPHPFR